MNTMIQAATIETAADMPEVKIPLHSEINPDDLSEWELARMTSKTWSMEQD